MPIYTKTGDKGTTALFGGTRVSKADLQVDAYGTIDELSSFLGFSISKIHDKNRIFLISIQKDLYTLMAVLSGAKADVSDFGEKTILIEKKIDELQAKLPPLTRFIIPGGDEVSSSFHISRSVCRRAERRCVELFSKDTFQGKDQVILKYINRLSDMLFVMARYYCQEEIVL